MAYNYPQPSDTRASKIPFTMSAAMNRSTIPAMIIAAVMLLAGGWVLGLVVDPAWIVGLERPAAPAEDDHPAHDDEHEGHVHLSESAFRNLNLRIRAVKLSDGKHTLQVPGEIVEKPGHSDHALASPVNGVVTEVYALPGQAIRPGDPLFKLQVIDEALATAQLTQMLRKSSLVVVCLSRVRAGLVD
jgi:multidrug efflux pump subunit AcrA (membrane-fusion protein)